ncbi:GntR family transcriptional regulator [Actinomadura sp. B10D3]|uniref:GntR family transcriptional regulator n=1 Tax=Actinomadura sp. B10D3 TaxID=3153557 RepID=UPI00325E83B7
MAGRVSKYSEIASDLRAKIENGTLGPGTRLPTKKELAESRVVSPSTIKKAVNELHHRLQARHKQNPVHRRGRARPGLAPRFLTR